MSKENEERNQKRNRAKTDAESQERESWQGMEEVI
jgi:hypothetical protein